MSMSAQLPLYGDTMSLLILRSRSTRSNTDTLVSLDNEPFVIRRRHLPCVGLTMFMWFRHKECSMPMEVLTTIELEMLVRI